MKLIPKQDERERRVFQFEKLAVEERADGMGPKITGYAAVFNRWSEDLGGFKERIKTGAFKKAIGKSDVRGLFNHDSNYVLGRQSNGTLQIKEDKNGLWMEIDPPDTQIIRDLVLAPIKRGDIKEQSFAFTVADDEWKNLHGEKPDEPATRTIMEVDQLFDVSPVTFPAYPDTSVALRSLEVAKEKAAAPVFEPLTIPDLFRHYAAQWEKISVNDSDKLYGLCKEMMTELNERFTAFAEPTQGNANPKGEPTQAPTITGEPTQAEPATREQLDKIIERLQLKFKE